MNRLQLQPLHVVLLLGASILLSACGDAPTEPDALLVTPETAPALRVDPAVPTLPGLIDDVAGEDAVADVDLAVLERAERLWRVAGRGRSDESAVRRDSAYSLAVPRLAAAVDSATVASYRERLEHWVEAASGALPGRGGAGIAAVLADARALLARADSRRARGDEAGAIEALLRASDRLVEVTPNGVARRLIRSAESALAAWPEASREAEGERGTSFRRAERLLDGAYEALDEGDTLRAIQRAYYATRLLEER